ncbi:hypothetical protein DIPPA_07656 [Diplonema papillatum]|nr:hypothetical protein DIPPA_07656 [Diplonema papillatum]
MLTFAVLLATAASLGEAASIGDEFYRTYTKYVGLPMTAAAASSGGWVAANTTCVPGLGYPMKLDDELQNTTLLYFDQRGNVSGISVDVFGSPPPQKLIDLGYWVLISHERYRISLGYRSPFVVCSPSTTPTKYPLGDRVVINPNGINQSLPLTVEAAAAESWSRGSCFYGMGHHWYYDVAGHPNMTWKAENLVPVVTMYNNKGALQATFFASWTIQQHPFNAGDWEPIPLSTGLMCKNFCSSDCHFEGTEFWSTYHVYMNPLADAVCADGCEIGCCA